MGRPIEVVTGEPKGPLAAATMAALARAGWTPSAVGPDRTSAGRPLVFVDDAGLPVALPRMIQLLPGRLTFPEAVVVAERPELAGGLVGEGFRDVVRPADAPRALDAAARGKAPVLLQLLRQEVEDELGRLVDHLRGQARERQTLVGECLDLVRAAAHLRKRIFRLGRELEKQSIDELLLQAGKVGDYIAALDERRGRRPGRLPAPPASLADGVLARREPRVRREVDDAIDWLREVGFLGALGARGLEAMQQTASTLGGRPLQALQDCLNIVEGETAQRLALIERLQSQASPMRALEERCLDRAGFAVLPPGIAVPTTVHSLLRASAQPPAELYATWCLDLRDLRIKQCADVLDDVAAQRTQRM